MEGNFSAGAEEAEEAEEGQILPGMGGEGKTGWDPGAQGSRAGHGNKIYQGRLEYAQFWPFCGLTRVPDGSNCLAII